MSWQEKVDELQQARAKALEMGGAEKVERQHKQGKLTARERINLLFDPGTFVEYGMLAHSSSPRLQMEGKPTPVDGVITGYGKINGRMALTIAEDFTVLGGSAMGGANARQAGVFAWPSADFGAIPVGGGVLAAYKREIEAAPDPEAKIRELQAQFDQYKGPYSAAGSDNIDDVIDPRETRPRIIRALELALNCRSVPAQPTMRHGVMP
ncbi:MAG: carboxyl transferase domain-containing protein [Bacillota bacterium]